MFNDRWDNDALISEDYEQLIKEYTNIIANKIKQGLDKGFYSCFENKQVLITDRIKEEIYNNIMDSINE